MFDQVDHDSPYLNDYFGVSHRLDPHALGESISQLLKAATWVTELHVQLVAVPKFGTLCPRDVKLVVCSIVWMVFNRKYLVLQLQPVSFG